MLFVQKVVFRRAHKGHPFANALYSYLITTMLKYILRHFLSFSARETFRFFLYLSTAKYRYKHRSGVQVQQWRSRSALPVRARSRRRNIILKLRTFHPQGLYGWDKFADKNRFRAEINAQIRDVDNPRSWTQSIVIYYTGGGIEIFANGCEKGRSLPPFPGCGDTPELK